jgi:hypothetical protein
MNKEKAVNACYRQELHYGECKRIIGPRGGITVKIEIWRVNGKCQTWKTRPEEFKLPIAYGLYDHSYVTETNCSEFHLASDCPLNKE